MKDRKETVKAVVAGVPPTGVQMSEMLFGVPLDTWIKWATLIYTCMLIAWMGKKLIGGKNADVRKGESEAA